MKLILKSAFGGLGKPTKKGTMFNVWTLELHLIFYFRQTTAKFPYLLGKHISAVINLEAMFTPFDSLIFTGHCTAAFSTRTQCWWIPGNVVELEL